MSNKVSNIENRERQRRRQSESGVLGTSHPEQHQDQGLYGAEKPASGVRGSNTIGQYRQDYISKRNGRSGQYSQGPEKRGDPYQQNDAFTRHPNKLSKLKNTSNSEA